MNERFESIKNSIKKADIFSCGSVNEMAIKNMGSIALTEPEYFSLDIKAFLYVIVEIEQIIFDKWGGRNATFYCWYDAMASEIRFSSLPGMNSELPFDPQPPVTTKIDCIVNKMYKEYQVFYEGGELSASDIEFLVYKRYSVE